MKYRTSVVLKSLTMISFVLLNHAGNAQAVLQKKFNGLLSLSGTWSMKTDKGILYEHWEKTNDSTLTGRSYMVNNSDTIILESVTLKQTENDIFYIPVTANQNNQQAVIFILIKTENNIYVFENIAHDFPQRVIYELPKDKKLHAWIEGNVDGNLKRSDYNYTAVR